MWVRSLAASPAAHFILLCCESILRIWMLQKLMVYDVTACQEPVPVFNDI